VIHKTVTLAEAPSKGQSILTYSPGSKGAKEYLALAQETVARLPAGQAMQINASRPALQ
jgi:chromosome partitioning protein